MKKMPYIRPLPTTEAPNFYVPAFRYERMAPRRRRKNVYVAMVIREIYLPSCQLIFNSIGELFKADGPRIKNINNLPNVEISHSLVEKIVKASKSVWPKTKSLQEDLAGEYIELWFL